MKLTRKQVMENIGKIQDLIGQAMGDFQNDRDQMRPEKVSTTLQKAFDLAVNTRD